MIDFNSFKKHLQKVEVKHFPHTIPDSVKVSILVQTYNHENYISKCLNSILSQATNFDFEIILGEDYSSDKTRSICLKYAKTYPEKIRLFLHDPKNNIYVNGIKTGNFNAIYSFFSARGKFIAFCEGDDYWTDSFKLQKQVDFLENNLEYSLTFHKFYIIDDKGKEINNQQMFQPTSDISEKNLTRLKYHPLFLTVCFRNRILKLPMEISEVINIDSFLLSLLGNFGKAKFQNHISNSAHRIHEGGIWSTRKKERKFILKSILYCKLKKFYKENGQKELYQHFNVRNNNIKKNLFYYYLKKGNIMGLLKSIHIYN